LRDRMLGAIVVAIAPVGWRDRTPGTLAHPGAPANPEHLAAARRVAAQIADPELRSTWLLHVVAAYSHLPPLPRGIIAAVEAIVPTSSSRAERAQGWQHVAVMIAAASAAEGNPRLLAGAAEAAAAIEAREPAAEALGALAVAYAHHGQAQRATRAFAAALE